MSKPNHIDRSVVIEVIGDFIRNNDGDTDTQCLLLAVGAELLNESIDTFNENFGIDLD